MQRPNATKCTPLLFLALVVTCTAASGEQPLEHSEWPTKDGYRIARQWTLQALEEPTPLRPAEDDAKAKSKRQLPPLAHDEDIGRLMWRADNTEKLPNSVSTPKAADERPRVPVQDMEESPLFRQVTNEVQHITGNVVPEMKVVKGRLPLPHQDFEAELASARERLGLGAAAWLVQRWDQHAAEAEHLLHESDRLVITPAPLPRQGNLETLTIHAGNQHNDELRRLTEGDSIAGEEQWLGLQPEQWQPVLQRTAYVKTVASAMGRRAATAAALRGAAPLTNARYDDPSPSIGSVQVVLPPARERVGAFPLAVEPTAYWRT